MSTRGFRVPAHEAETRRSVIAPDASVFLSANAGSGKTTILTDRVVRLLLDGVAPERILCVTYTKAAAAEMQNRIFDVLARWVRLDDTALREEIAKRLDQAPGPRLVGQARELFARAVETPGGLKIQTIHAFAERLLHLFPFEANVPARFSVLDDLTAGELLTKARRQTLAEALAEPASATGVAFRTLAARIGEDGLEKLILQSLPLIAGVDLPAYSPKERRRVIATLLAADPDDTDERIMTDTLALPFGPAAWPDAIEMMVADGKNKTEIVAAESLRNALKGSAADQYSAMQELFLKKEGDLRKNPLTDTFLKSHPRLAGAVERTKRALPDIIERSRAKAVVERSEALMVLIEAVHARFARAKADSGFVDFNDIIDRTRRLVQDEGAAWVMRKLDGGIDHVLLDEAQDTTPAMWDILSALTAEFFAGEGARKLSRSVFVVGDEKQSIYSFQGARPKTFAEQRSAFRKKAAHAGVPFLERELKLSFRTVADVLAAVDTVFAEPENRRGLTADGIAPPHEAARHGAPGMVDLWPLEEQVSGEKRAAWEEVDALGQHSAPVALANRVAQHIAHLLRQGRHEDDGARIVPGDIMVLVQARGPFFEAVIRALKRLNIPVAGADRLQLTTEMAVLDLVAAARLSLLPDDDLTCAVVLKSPLIGLDDADLMRLLPTRTGSLLAALGASDDPRHRAAFAMLSRWQELARTLTPYGFFSHLLGPEGGRQKLLGRLGVDAADGLEMYLSAVLEREMREPPSLMREVEAFETLTTAIKRDQEQGGSVVRVMTVHGAKGLEARIVYLPDANRTAQTSKESSLYLEAPAPTPDDLVLISAPRKEERPALVNMLAERRKVLREEEYRRLFYVAMTRARDRLIIAGCSDKRSTSGALSWYDMAEAALGPRMRDVTDTPDGPTIRRFRTVDTPPATDAPDRGAAAPPTELPGWIGHDLAAEAPVAPPLRPAHAIEAADWPLDSSRDLARATGDAVHLLLQYLPAVTPANRAAWARQRLTARWPALAATSAERLVSDALAILDDARCSALFSPGSEAEVDIAGEVTLPDGRVRAVSGRMDRVHFGDDRIIVADFKTGTPPGKGHVPPRHAVQLALYHRLLTALFPEKPVTALIIYTRTGRIDALANETLAEALTLL